MCAGRLPCGSGGWWARTPSTGHASRSLDHLIRPLQERRRDRQAEGLGGLEIEEQFEFGGLLKGKVGGLDTLQDLVDVGGGASVQFTMVGGIGHQSPSQRVLLHVVESRDTAPCGKGNDLVDVSLVHGVTGYEKRTGSVPRDHPEGGLKVVGVTHANRQQLQTLSRGCLL